MICPGLSWLSPFVSLDFCVEYTIQRAVPVPGVRAEAPALLMKLPPAANTIELPELAVEVIVAPALS